MTHPTESNIVQLVDIPEAAKLLTCSVSTVRRFIQTRSIPFYRIGKGIRFSQEDIRVFIEQQRTKRIEEYIE